jgi:hypothetical protein
MRRIDAIGIGIAIFATGGVIYLILQLAGIDTIKAGVWTQAILVFGLIGWLVTYLYRVLSQNMTYNQQRKDYEDKLLRKRLEEMTPEELEQLQAEIEQEK